MARTKSKVVAAKKRADTEPAPVLEVKDASPRILRVEEVADRLAVSPDTLRLWWRDPHKFGVPPNLPKPRQVGPNRVGCIEEEVDACIRTLPISPILGGMA